MKTGSRETWVIGCVLKAAIQAADSVYCSSESETELFHAVPKNTFIQELSGILDISNNQLENTIAVLQAVQQYRSQRKSG